MPTREPSWHPSGPLTLGDALEAGRADARRLLRPPPLCRFPPPRLCSHPRWLWPRRHAEQQHLAQRPDVIRQPRRHGWRPRLPRAWPSPCRWSARAAAAAGVSWHAASRNCSTRGTSASCWRKPSSPLHSVVTRRPTAATCWRMVRLTRSMKAVLICQPQAASTCWTAARVPNTTRWLHADQAPPPHGLDHLRIEQLRAAASSAAWARGLWPGGAAAAPTGRSASAARSCTP